MRQILRIAALLLLAPFPAVGQKPPLLPEKDVAALAQELSGETAKRNLEGLTRFHRQRGSQGFHAAAELIAERARAYGLSDVQILQFPSDGRIFYGTQRSRPPWDAEFAELWEVANVSIPPVCDKEKIDNGSVVFNTKCEQSYGRKIASYEAEPVVLAEDSESADVTTDLIDVGDGTKDGDYSGKDVRGKIVLAAAQPGAVQDLAAGKFHAAGIVSYAQNQKTAWSGEDENLIRWGHLETFSPSKTFAFMVSLKTARTLRDRLSKGEQVKLHAVVKAGQHPGNLEVVTATIPGADPKLKSEEIAFSCHLDHQRPGANDNASGCVTILEVARTLQKLIAEHKLARPARTIRFIWPPEIEGTLTLLNVGLAEVCVYGGPLILSKDTLFHISTSDTPPDACPSLAKRIKAVVHMDMVGGGPVTKTVFHVTRGPMSLPSFIHDVAWAFAEFVNEQSYNFAAGLPAEYPLVAPEGGKEALQAMDTPYTMGSDHDVYQDSSFKIPAIYLNDWPDRYVHTNFDTAANIDPTKLKRAAFIGVASGYFLARMTANDTSDIALNSEVRGGRLSMTMTHRMRDISPNERQIFNEAFTEYVSRADDSIREFLNGPRAKSSPQNSAAQASGADEVRFVRKPTPKGPVTVFGYDFVNDHTGAQIARPKILDYEGLWGSGEEYAYETLNFADGKRKAQQIRDAVSAEYGPVPLDLVVEYLKTLEKIGIVEQVK